MDHSKKSTYLFSIDALRVIAILAVILIHATTNTMASLKLQIELAPISLFLNQIARFAVPLFFLISGFVLELNYKSKLSYLVFFKRRASRIIIPYFFWSCIYVLFARNFDALQLFNLKFIWNLILGTASYHLYFIPTVIIFYLVFPFLHSIIRFLKNPAILSIILLIQLLLLYRDYYIKTWNIQYDLRVAFLSFGMFVLGMVASHHHKKIFLLVKKYSKVLVVGLTACALFIPLHVFEMTLKFNTSRFIYNQYSPLNYVYTVLLFLFLFYKLEKTQLLKSVFIKLSKLSFFVFFIHVLIQNLIWKNILTPVIKQNGNQILMNYFFDILLFLTIASISFGIAYIIHKIPYASKITA